MKRRWRAAQLAGRFSFDAFFCVMEGTVPGGREASSGFGIALASESRVMHVGGVVMRSKFLVAWVFAAVISAAQAQTVIIPRSTHARAVAPRRHTAQAPASHPHQHSVRLPVVTNTPPAAAPTTVLVVPAPVTVDPEKARAEQEAVLKHTIEFQRARAESGSAQAQYDLGKRHLTGDGVEKNYGEARKWLAMSAQQGNELADAKLEQLNRLEHAEAGAPQ